MSDEPHDASNEPRLLPMPKPSVNGLLLDRIENASLEVAHMSSTVQAQTEYLVETVTSAKWLLLLLTAALLLNTMLLLAILVAVSFLFGALR